MDIAPPAYSHAGIDIHIGDCADILPSLGERTALALTSPPYGAARDYGGHGFDFAAVAPPIAAAVADSGAMAWVERGHHSERRARQRGYGALFSVYGGGTFAA